MDGLGVPSGAVLPGFVRAPLLPLPVLLLEIIGIEKPRARLRFSGYFVAPEVRAQLGRVGGGSSRQIAKLVNCASSGYRGGTSTENTGSATGRPKREQLSAKPCFFRW